MLLIDKEGKIIEANEKTYRLLYRERGFKEYDPSNHDIKRDNDTVNTISHERDKASINEYKHYTNKELKEELDSRGISYNDRDKKAKLIERLVGA